MDARGRASKRRRLVDGSSTISYEDADNSPIQSPCISLRSFKDSVGSGQKAPPHDTFYLFSKLPAELRVYIWREVAREATKPFHPLRVRVYRGAKRVSRPGTKRGYGNQTCLRLASMPDLGPATRRRRALLQISREARTEMLKLWDTEVEVERRGILRFSYKYDLVYLDIINAAVMEVLIEFRLENNLPDFAKVIGHVGFEMIPSLPLWLLDHEDDLEPNLSLILCFPKLHSLSLVSFTAFQSEIDWTCLEDTSWVLSRTRAHQVYLRRFPTISHVDYTAQSTVGKRASGPRDKHECTICTIHKCVSVNQLIGKRACSIMQAKRRVDDEQGGRRRLTSNEMAWLRRLKHHTLIASTNGMAPHVPMYKCSTAGWWMNRRTARRRCLGHNADSGCDAHSVSCGNSEDNTSSHEHASGNDSTAQVHDVDVDSEAESDDEDNYELYNCDAFGHSDLDFDDDDDDDDNHGEGNGDDDIDGFFD
ncbi:hypothetical protein SEPCBS57363_001365 [Sporothrix epigloea]|uniref:2EXR domain-containing protein n=1 Tax=Sporothrix epigloea TaxID=1892477 RepID=A0ABP0DA60_9PEZI